jgi:hypothetical protein
LYGTDHSTKVSRFGLRTLEENFFDAGKDTSSSFHFLEQNFFMVSHNFLLKIGDPMNKIINKKITQLIEGGIVQKLEKDRFTEIKKRKRDIINATPQPDVGKLTLEHLGLSFLAILICLSLSFVVFLLECVTGFVMKKLNFRVITEGQ